MSIGKKKCRILKEIRAEIAKNNDIAYTIEECKYQGDCTGTCPKCEAEVAALEAELAKRQSAGKRVLLTGVAASMVVSMSSCTPPTLGGDPLPGDETVQSQPADSNGPAESDFVTVGEISLPDSSDEGDGQIQSQPADSSESAESEFVLDDSSEEDVLAGEPEDPAPESEDLVNGSSENWGLLGDVLEE